MKRPILIEHQPDAAPGCEWFYSVPAPFIVGDQPANSCGTTSTRSAAVDEVNKLCALFGYDARVTDPPASLQRVTDDQ